MTGGPAWARRAARALERGRDPLAVSAGLARRAEALVRLLLRRAAAELGPAPAPYAWLVLGGAGRRESAPGADLDHALAHAAEGTADAAWYAAAAARVARGLGQAGLSPCPGGWSAERRQGDLRTWSARVERWRGAEPEGLLALAAFLDHRRAAGRLDVSALGGAALRAAAAPPVRAALGEGALRLRSGSAQVVRLAPARPLDLKRDALGPLVAAARALALWASPAPARGTLARLEAARGAGLLGADTAADAEAALRFLTGLRLRRGLSAVLAGVLPSAVVIPAALPAGDRARLAAALSAVRAVQRRVEAVVG